MKRILLIFSSICLTIILSNIASAQEYGEFSNDGYNHNSVRPVHESHVMYKKTLWYRSDLREKLNKPLFTESNEISRLITDAAKLGIVRPFKNDSLTSRLSDQEFRERLKIPGTEPELSPEEIGMGFPEDEWSGDDGGWGSDEDDTPVNQEYFPNEICIMEIKEHLLFDKKKARMTHDIQALTFIIPAEKNMAGTGLEIPVASFSYKELVQNLFRDNPQAVWYSRHNEMSTLNLEQAFDLRLFESRLIKYSNWDDSDIYDMNDSQDHAALVDAQKKEYWYVEYESNLWEN